MTESGSPSDVLPWQLRDVVLDANGNMWTRAEGDRWPWASGYANTVRLPEGDVADRFLKRPVTLLIRGGKPVGGVLVNDDLETGSLLGGAIEATP